ncbi:MULTISPECIES: glycine cleavage system protein GcvH [Pseudomonas]|uniref:Glycine cleavage system H protein n=1 Tax=Ectopseudomonas khazarica TaxID=2502979 RepID=A0ABW7MA61_9GAMM|nr:MULTISPECIES: glycine cleavage system protein GcvH [Pseudomonas]TNF16534.1 MAG: glycine cleavage system protein GcvH [Pseudomonadales bacterium]HIQ43956.1 glycine cleavage system protein GcvH [Pseudomonas oleovorans]QFT21277.1 Glycine cleavage system H protein [Pseudomonas sp. THAF187a]QFT41465.1 Glycine cleavage system H protein [Pseudomonas sp. THAF42]QTS87898.1 glycine cleavage system protein GcvH [Pseudomonas khazarica]|tara:strand:+ start:9027 stop:9410 length:384 start_codon:yes stop_codon:yes gene_type:complete
MSELRFTADHEWLRLDNDGLVTVGITHYAQDALGDVVYVQLPEAKSYAQGEEVAVLESVKAASNIVMPLDGEIVELNGDLEGSPELVNESPLDKAWFFRMRLADNAVLADLLDQAGYDRLLNANADA